jgi:ATP-dependent protease ClpP protease subunit
MNFIQIENRAGKLKLNDGVYKESADKLLDDLAKLYGPAAVAAQMCIGDIVCSADNALEEIEVEINSPGGSVFEGQRIYNALREASARGVKVTTIVDTIAASMGSVILMAGDERLMKRGSQIMIHEASTISWGDARTMKRNADLLENISSQIAGIYAERTGGDSTAIRDLMFAETWMDADKAIELGFAHALYDPDKQDDDDMEDRAAFDTEAKGMSILARLFPGNDQVAQLEAQIAENDTLRADILAAQERIAELADIEAAVALKDTEIQNLAAEKAEIEGKLVESETKITELTAGVEITEAKIGERAAEMLAATGHPAPVNLSDDNGGVSILAQFEAITDAATATKFYQQHRKAILAEQSKINIKSTH